MRHTRPPCSARPLKRPSFKRLRVLVRPMPGFSGIHAVCGTAFGSVDAAFELDGARVEVPAGTAHFLEHKMFESEEGDAFALYAATGASANAFTSFDKTCYLFTCTDRFEENLAILLGLVSKPYFTEQTIAKEQGIIGQEIKMYEDSPEWRLVFGVYRGLYGAHPVREDIAGTVQSIARLTPQLLYSCTDAFYSPGQLVLAVAGNVTLAQVVAAAEKTPFASGAHTVRPPDACRAAGRGRAACVRLHGRGKASGGRGLQGCRAR